MSYLLFDFNQMNQKILASIGINIRENDVVSGLETILKVVMEQSLRTIVSFQIVYLTGNTFPLLPEPGSLAIFKREELFFFTLKIDRSVAIT